MEDNVLCSHEYPGLIFNMQVRVHGCARAHVHTHTHTITHCDMQGV